MTPAVESIEWDGQQVVCMRSRHLEANIAPQVGGRILGLRHLASCHEFLWKNPRLQLERKPPGSEYDPNFYGGIDELLPNDLPETVDGIAYPDHGELWTHGLDWRIDGQTLVLEGKLPRCGLTYERRMLLRADSPHVDMHYRLTNPTDAVRHFMWKLHAAVAVAAGDVIDCPARQAQVVDPDGSQSGKSNSFCWPHIEGRRADVVPESNGTLDFFYLFDLETGRIAWRRPSLGLKLEYTYDTGVFPYTWLFASYGGFDGHYTAVLEPCTTMPIRVGEAIGRGTCGRLMPGESLETNVTIYAGPDAAHSPSERRPQP